MSSTRSDVNYHGKAARPVRPRERIDRGAKFTNAVQFPYNGTDEDITRPIRSARGILQKAATSLWLVI